MWKLGELLMALSHWWLFIFGLDKVLAQMRFQAIIYTDDEEERKKKGNKLLAWTVVLNSENYVTLTLTHSVLSIYRPVLS